MTRAMFQVLVIPFRRTAVGIEFAALRRSDCGAWQGIAGGGEDGESIAESARREVAEETGLTGPRPLYRLQTTSSIPASCFKDREGWPRDVYVIPEYAFGLDCTGEEIVLSEEHSAIRWGSLAVIDNLLTWDSNKTALGELNERLQRNDLQPADGP